MLYAHTKTVALSVIVVVLAGCGGTHLEVPTPTRELYSSLDPVAIHALSTFELYVVGSVTLNDGNPEGLILASETGGRTWRRLAVEVHDLGRTTFQTVHFADRLRGWVGGLRVDDRGRTRGVVFRTEDGGNHWRETMLVQDPNVLISQIHSIAFVSDLEGAVVLSILAPGAKEPRQTAYVTRDAGRTWSVASYREVAKVPFVDHSRSMLDVKRGFRLRKSKFPGIHVIESTVSEGKDWMPISEISVAALNTYY